MRSLLLAAVIGALTLAAPAGASAADLYVAPTGSDLNPGLTPAAPLRSVGKALSLSAGGETVHVAAGTYTKPTTNLGSVTYTDKRPHASTVTVAGEPGAILQGLRLEPGSTNVRLQGLEFTDTLSIFGARNVEVAGNDFHGMTYGILLRGGAASVNISANRFHDLGTAIEAPAYGSTDPAVAKFSTGIRITDNVIEDLTQDGIQFGWWNDVEISGNVMRRLDYPSTAIHNDGIQSYGNVTGLRILRNTISNSAGQGMLISAEKGPIENARIDGNLIYMTDAVPLYTFDVSGLTVINNTVWRQPGKTSLNAITLKRRDTSAAVGDTIVANNLASEIAYNYPVAVRAYNWVGAKGVWWTRYQLPGPGERSDVGDPGFVDRVNANFHLAAGLKARGAGTAAYGLGLDRDGLTRATPPSIGAFE
jgi:hypothetical protein